MARALVLTVIGKDRPGLVEALADLIAQHEGNWDESRMARLAGHFAGVVQIHLPENQAEAFIAALPTLANRGLSISVVDSDWTRVDVDHLNSLQLELVGQDRPGIVREISNTLATLGSQLARPSNGGRKCPYVRRPNFSGQGRARPTCPNQL